MILVHRLIHLALLTFVAMAHAAFEAPCLEALIASGDVRVVSTVVNDEPRTFEITDLERGNPKTFGLFRLERRVLNGVLLFDIKTVRHNGERSKVLRARQLFDEMMKFFDGHVHTIRAQWLFGTNLDQFNQFIREGASLEGAAARTWTGTQAARYGFTKVDFSLLMPSEGPEFTTVVARFRP